MRIVLIDDDQRLLDALVTAFKFCWPGAEVLTATDGETGLDLMSPEGESSAECPADIVVLDVGLPDRSGFAVLADIRRMSDVPVVLLTAAKEEADQVRGLEMGADDYVTKPFNTMMLLAHVKAVLRRARPLSHSSGLVLSAGQVHLDVAQRDLIGPGGRVHLTPIEFRVVSHLMLNVGHVVYQSALIRRVWGDDDLARSHDLRMFIAKLRTKLAVAGAPRAIVTERGVGYSIVPAE
jgi:two-component system KDP operon response regulator KdpE